MTCGSRKSVRPEPNRLPQKWFWQTARSSCHPERSEGSAVFALKRGGGKQILRRFAPQNDIHPDFISALLLTLA